MNSLARLRLDTVLEAFLQLSDGGRSFLRRLRLPPKTPVLVAVIRALSLTWSDDRRAAAVLAAAARSSDPELRQAVSAQHHMSDPVRFLNAFAHSLGVMTLYPEGHPSREKAVDSAFDELDGLTMAADPMPAFTFLEDEVVFGRERLRELKSWDWGKRLVAAGIQRLEFERKVTRDEFTGFLQEVLARLMLSTIDTSEARQMRSLGIRFGAVGLQGQDAIDPALDAAFAALPTGDAGSHAR